ncbi:unnamed protein product [Phaedon cochleariae]|uniref:RING-CH-type domain-containing protein n=1 Tax=Phaedon cochleariae TaxID=80249 RepID=A0A9P0GUF0_PHACE|nr:unnamed protein product [Phaedon cochleariae]
MSDEIKSFQSIDKLKVVSGIGPEKTSSHKTLSKISVHKSPKHVQSVASIVCRICHTNTVNEALISPCNCKGSLAYVHLSCLERWLNQSSRSYCELCMFRYSSVQTKRYGLCRGIRLWMGHPRNRGHVRSDAIIAVLLTLVTSGLLTCSFLGMEYFVSEGGKLGIQRKWIRTSVSMFILAVVMGYVVTIYLIIRDQVIPWHRWWISTVDIRLVLPSSVNCKFFKGNDSVSSQM